MPDTISRRKFNCLAAAAGGMGAFALTACDENASHFMPAWTRFRSQHISSDGRVIDSANGNISHSEGQGFALLLAEAAGDYAGFLKLKAWTDYVLGTRDDSLFAWRFEPYRGRKVPDLNNATDGDILIAWALLRAGRRWQKPAFTQQAEKILDDVERSCVFNDTPFGPLLKPGATGFETDQGLVVNPSYFVFPAFAAFAAFTGRALWQTLTDAGLSLLGQAQFSGFDLPPDWVHISSKGAVEIADDYPPHYGWNAIRVPLYLLWAKKRESEAHLQPFTGLIDAYGSAASIPAWIDLKTGETASFNITGGGADIYRLVDCQTPEVAIPAGPCGALVAPPPSDPSEDYYSSALSLLTRLAYFEISPDHFQVAPRPS